jgi:hypothetical protein
MTTGVNDHSQEVDPNRVNLALIPIEILLDPKQQLEGDE